VVVNGTQQQLAVPADWVGYELGLTPPKVHDVHPLGTASSEEVAPEPDSGDEGTAHLVVADEKLGIEYQIDLEESTLRAIGAHMAARMRSSFGDGIGVEVQDEPVPSELAAEGAAAADNRVRFGIADGSSANNWPFRTIGALNFPGPPVLNAACTVTFLSANVAITAAHCVLDSNHNTVFGGNFAPRQDGTDPNPFLNPVQPFGLWTYDRILFSMAFRTMKCKQAGTGVPPIDKCFGHDWALLNVHRPPNVSFPGAMCWGWADDNLLRSSSLFTRGYPRCPVGSVPNCTNNTLYGEPNKCVLGQTWDPESDGWHRTAEHSCLISPGDSGSSVYANAPSWMPGCDRVLVGVNSGRRTAANGGKAAFRRITPWLAGQISTVMSSWPL
jgi:V8-like Glu-specific endopeptidase